MHYQLSEEAFYSLESARNQLRFVVNLGSNQPTLQQVTASDMLDFIDAQQATITAVLNGATFHVPTPLVQQPVGLSSDVIAQTIHVVSGGAAEPQDVFDLYDLLAKQAPSASIFRAFLEALVRQGFDLATMSRGDQTSTTPVRKARAAPDAPKRKRDRLTAGAV